MTRKSLYRNLLHRCFLLILLLCILLGISACGSSDAENESATEEKGKEEENSDTEYGFNPDTEKDSLTIEEFRSLYGEEVPIFRNIHIGAVIKSQSNEFWRTFQSGYEDMANETGIDLTIKATDSEEDIEGQKLMGEQLLSEEGDRLSAIMLSPITDDNLLPLVEEAAKKEILTVNVNDGLIEEADHYVGPNAYQNGSMAAEWISKQLDDEGQVAVIKGMEDAYATRERTQGFEDWITDNKSGLRLVGEENADWDRARAKEITANWLTQYPGLKAIFCNNDDMALGAEEAVEESGLDVLVVGVDGIGEAYDSIRAGKLDATVDSFPYYMAKVALECTLRSIAGQELPSVITTPQALIDAENVDEDPAEMINWVEPYYITED